MRGLECENGSFFLYVFTCVLWMICVGSFLFRVIVVVVFLNAVSFWIYVDTFPWEKRKSWGLE